MNKYVFSFFCCLICAASVMQAEGVRINEFLADNGGSFLTQAGLAEDWIEIYNDSAETVNLGGWYLTDKAKDLTQWRFPDDTLIQPFGYVLVFADSSAVSLVNGELHASFSLSKDGEYLALVQPDGVTIANHFSPAFPAQYPDISYGVALVEGEWVETYFTVPTPGAANGDSGSAPTPAVVISEPRGYKTVPFTVSLTCPDTPGAAIYYTLDGSTPSLANGTLYTAPLAISQTTVLRAAVPAAHSVHQNTATASWFFLDDVLRQSATRPAGWPDSTVNRQQMRYGMSAEILAADEARLSQGITNAIPTLSLVTDLANLFDAETGIYVNAQNDGREWERPVSVELIDPVRSTTAEFHIDGGLRIRGGVSRGADNPRHSLRLFFRSEYGESKLTFPLFDAEGASEFTKVDLRTSQNYAWAYQLAPSDADKCTFVREVFSRDTQRDMGTPYTRSRYYHLYLNGLYWGLYQTQERVDPDFASTYLGGKKSDWDIIKSSGSPDYICEVSDGTLDAYNAFHALAIYNFDQGFTSGRAANYQRVKGLNPDGTRNPDYPIYLDEDNLICFMLNTWYTNDPDSPIAISGVGVNNMYAVFNRASPDGFKWFRHDAEHSLGAHPDSTVDGNTFEKAKWFDQQRHFNPAVLHRALVKHPDYKMRFADLAWRHCIKEGGALTPEVAQARFRSRMAEIDLAIIGESARWGNGKTRDADWIPACENVTEEFLVQRRDIFINQLRAEGWYPAIEPPAFTMQGDTLTITAAAPFHYTTDGSDPRAPGGGIASTALNGAYRTELPLTAGMTIATRARSESEWSVLVDFTTDSEPAANPYAALRVSKLMYAPSKPTAAETAMNYVNDDFAWLELRNTGTTTLEMEGVTVSDGIDHTFQAYSLDPDARLILAKNPTAFPLRYAVPEGTPVIAWSKGNLSRSGESLVFTAPDGQHILTFTYSDAWYPTTKNTGYCLVALDLSAEEPAWNTAAQWRPSNFIGGTPGAPDARKPVVQTMQMSAEGTLTFNIAALDGKVNVLYSRNLIDWALCPAETFQIENSAVIINSKHEAFGSDNRCFFVIRVED